MRRPSELHVTHRFAQVAVLAAAAAALGACATTPPPEKAPPPPPVHVMRGPPPPPPVDTNVYAYPVHGQTPEQLDRDRYECYVWANKQTGFDPSAPNVPPQAQVHVVSGPAPGAGVATGAVVGGVLGAAISAPWARGAGAITGALIGSAVGASAEASARNQEAMQASAANRAQAVQMAQVQQKALDYRRALSACLEGRGYSVR
ncbi:MAG TPA: hypothetical protein VLV29_09925 [Steroidobacteraceae bacterium]|nr:hypothetical protein [Steroidobacteraceae bacterium]HUL19569.1 hypothetical protein [Steroidobacteraceae bacterium]